MKRLFATILLLLACTLSYASNSIDARTVNDAGFSDLSDIDKADLIKQIADKKAAKANSAKQVIPDVSTPQKVNEWLDIGTRIGSGMAGAAKEMGVAVNEFAKSPVGLWTITLITWHFMGGVLVHIVGGLLVWLIGFSFIWWVSRRVVREEIIYDKEKTDIFGRSRLLSVNRGEIDGDYFAGQVVMAFIVTAVGIATMFSY